MFEQIRQSVAREARMKLGLGDIDPSANLFDLGLTPYSAVRLLLAVEREYGVEAPRERLTRAHTSTITAIAETIAVACRTTARRAA
jgi:acyl carrier protein